MKNILIVEDMDEIIARKEAILAMPEAPVILVGKPDPIINRRDYNLESLKEQFESIDYESLTNREKSQIVTPIRTDPKIDRNSLCPCGSGKKYKKCCLNKKS